MDSFEQIKVTFFQECQELLGDLETGLLALETGEGDDETINAVFRAVHSVKGGAGAFGLDDLVTFAHVFETTLDEMRTGRLAPSDAVVKTMLRAADMLADHVAAAQGRGAADAARSAQLAQALTALTQEGPVAEPPPAAEPAFTPMRVDIETPPSDAPQGDEFGFTPMRVVIDEPAAAAGWRIEITPKAEMYAKAGDITPLLRELERLGACATVVDGANLPPLDAMDPEGAYLTWTVEFSGDAARSVIEEVFEFVDGDCELKITPLGGAAAAAPAMDIEALLAAARTPNPPAPEGQVQAMIDQVVPFVIASSEAPEQTAIPADIEAMLAAARLPPPPPADGEMQAIVDTVSPPIPATVDVDSDIENHRRPAVDAQDAARGGAPSTAPQSTIRVDLERVDRLIDLVGELVINQAMLAQRVIESGIPRSSAVQVGLDDLEHLTRDIQDSVMAIRAQPVKSVFQRMPRLAREIAAATGKQVRLVMEGEGTEVDKTVIERLTDPITHMIRNAIDHGLETPAVRAAAGKPQEGTVRLAALHRSGRIVIEVGDDGKGIDRTRVRQIAVDKGLIDADAVLNDEEVDNLLFLPGFSTASTVSNISGRGVGMDVVKRSIQALGGRISITSVPGKGSTFTMSLPLTLAVLDGMVVTVGDQTLVASLTSIIETLQPKPADVRSLGPNSRVIAVRDSYVPLLDIGAVLGWREEVANPAEGVCLLVENEAGGRAALLVDAIQGQRQVVIKSLEANYQQVPGIAAATILGDGRVALILDIDAAINLRAKRSAPSLALAS